MAEPQLVPQPQPLMTQPLTVDDFSGGMTDNYIACDPRQFQTADNFLLKKYGAKAKLITRPGSTIYNSSYYRIPANARLSGLVDSEGTLFQLCGKNVYTIGGSGWTTLAGPTSNTPLQAGTATSYLSWAKWNKHLLLTTDAISRPMKIFNDGSWRVRNMGLPQINSSSITLTPTAGANSYIYAFVHADTYTIGSVTFREVSAPSAYKTCASADAPNTNQIAIASIPTLANSTTGNYNTAAIKIEIYRTTNGGTTLYKVGEVTNGTTTYNDTMSDATLVNQTVLYTDGGTVDFDEPPLCKYVIVANDIAWYLHVQEGSSVYPNRVRQSVQGALYAAPESFYDDLEDEIVGGAAWGIHPLIFCKNRVYRLEGYFDEFGGGGFIKREIPGAFGCVSGRSIVTARDGVYWASEQGFFWTDGFQSKKISGEFNTSYANLVATDTQKARIYGCYDPIENRILWAAQNDDSSNDNDIIYVCDLNYQNLPFTTISGAGNVDNFAPTSLIFFGGYILRGDRRGYLFQHVTSTNTDPKIDTSSAPSTWNEVTIMYDYRGPAFDFGTTEVRKWVPRIVVNADNVSNVSLLIGSNNDNSGVFDELAEVKYSSNYLWGDETAIWGDDSVRWNYVPTVSHWRRFPAGGLRCLFKQIRLSNSYTEIDSTTNTGTATTDDTLNTVTLDSAGKTWIPGAVDYYVSFSEDSYDKEYLVTARTDTVLTVTDAGGNLGTISGRTWKLKGYKKDEVLNILSYVVDYAMLTMSQTPYRSS